MRRDMHLSVRDILPAAMRDAITSFGRGGLLSAFRIESYFFASRYACRISPAAERMKESYCPFQTATFSASYFVGTVRAIK